MWQQLPVVVTDGWDVDLDTVCPQRPCTGCSGVLMASKGDPHQQV